MVTKYGSSWVQVNTYKTLMTIQKAVTYNMQYTNSGVLGLNSYTSNPVNRQSSKYIGPITVQSRRRWLATKVATRNRGLGSSCFGCDSQSEIPTRNRQFRQSSCGYDSQSDRYALITTRNREVSTNLGAVSSSNQRLRLATVITCTWRPSRTCHMYEPMEMHFHETNMYHFH